MRAALEVGRRLGTSRRGDELWRAALIAVCVFTATVTALVGLSLQHTLAAERQRVTSRSPVIGPDNATAGLLVRDALDAIGGQQFTVRWLETDGSSQLPPGVDPETFSENSFVISPALAESLTAAASERFEPHGIIGDDGLRNRDELFAYARVPSGRSLGAAGRSVARFGGGPAASSDVEAFPLAIGILTFLVLPCVALLAVGTTARADQHSYRCQLLGRLGVPRRYLALVGAAETFPPSVVGAATGFAVYLVWANFATTVPVLDRRIIAGDLRVSHATSVIVVLSVIGIACMMASHVAVRRAKMSSFNRPTHSDTPLRGRRLAPFVVGLVLLLAGLVQSGSSSASYAILAGGALITAGVPLVLPVIAQVAGEVLGGAESLTLAMIGRRLQRDPRQAMRPLLTFGAVITMVTIMIGYLAVVRFDDEPRPAASQLRAVTFRFAPGGTTPEIADIGTDRLLLAEFDSGTGVIDTSCARLASHITDPCGADGQLSKSAASAIGAALAIPPRFAGRISIGTHFRASGNTRQGIALGQADDMFAEEVRAVLQDAGLVAAEVTDLRELNQRESPLVKWILAGLTIAIAISTIGLVILTIERYAHSLKDHQILGILGLPTAKHWQLEVGQFATAIVVTCGVALACGIIGSAAMTRAAFVPYPTGPVLLTAGLVLACSAAATVAITLISGVRIRSADNYMTEAGYVRWTS